MNNQEEAGSSDERGRAERAERHGRKLDPISLIAGIITLVVATYVLTGGAVWGWVNGVGPLWLLAGGAVLVGILMLGASARRGRG